jgi:hypothetical protein
VPQFPQGCVEPGLHPFTSQLPHWQLDRQVCCPPEQAWVVPGAQPDSPLQVAQEQEVRQSWTPEPQLPQGCVAPGPQPVEPRQGPQLRSAWHVLLPESQLPHASLVSGVQPAGSTQVSQVQSDLHTWLPALPHPWVLPGAQPLAPLQEPQVPARQVFLPELQLPHGSVVLGVQPEDSTQESQLQSDLHSWLPAMPHAWVSPGVQPLAPVQAPQVPSDWQLWLPVLQLPQNRVEAAAHLGTQPPAEHTSFAAH